MGLAVNGLDVASMRLLAPWSGVWTAELELSLDALIAPSGKVAITSTDGDGFALVGTVDGERSGTFADKRHVRVLGGGGGWGKEVRAQHFHSDLGVTLLEVATSTGALAGEAVVAAPKFLGTDFVRLGTKPAAQIFTDADVDWWVGYDGITKVGLRPPMPQPKSLALNDWQPADGTVSFAADTLPEPGQIVIDDRFGLGIGKRVIRKVEAVVDGSAAAVTGTLWLGEDAPDRGHVSELAKHVGALVRGAARPELGRVYEYRVIAMAGDRAELQAVKRDAGVPDLLPCSVWAGISGYRGSLKPTSRVLVGFIGGDPSKPYVAAYEPPEGGGWRPLELELDAEVAVRIGGQAPLIALGGELGAQPVALAPPVITALEAVATYIAALTAALVANPALYPGFAAAMAAPGATVATALGLVAAAAPSKKVVAA